MLGARAEQRLRAKSPADLPLVVKAAAGPVRSQHSWPEPTPRHLKSVGRGDAATTLGHRFACNRGEGKGRWFRKGVIRYLKADSTLCRGEWSEQHKGNKSLTVQSFIPLPHCFLYIHYLYCRSRPRHVFIHPTGNEHNPWEFLPLNVLSGQVMM
jgi:hypothetical protein